MFTNLPLRIWLLLVPVFWQLNTVECLGQAATGIEVDTTIKKTKDGRQIMCSKDSTGRFTAEVMPETDYNVNRFLAKNIHYPIEATKNDISGTVWINFRVNPDGSLEDFNVDKGIGYGCDEETLRAAKLFPPRKPGCKTVRQYQ